MLLERLVASGSSCRGWSGGSCSCGLGPAASANRVLRLYRLLPRRVKSDRLLEIEVLLLVSPFESAYCVKERLSPQAFGVEERYARKIRHGF